MMRVFLVAVLVVLGAWRPAVAAEPAIPRFWDTSERLQRPDLSDLARLRFLTTADFPPFSFLDAAGRLTGFHVDLARAVCGELGLLARCEIQAVPFDELEAALALGEGEAIVAGLAVTDDTRQRLSFSRPYLQFPARFVMRGRLPDNASLPDTLAGKRVGVMAGSAHERMLRSYFADTRPVTYDRADWMLGDLKEGKVDAVFGDGLRLSFWLGGPASESCCAFAGGPYLAPEFLGRGLTIATRKDDTALAQGFNFALREIHDKGVFAELYLRYFPVGFY